eukprot:2361813-Amphidinium_carterae.1
MNHQPSGTPLPNLILNPGGALPQIPHPQGGHGSTSYEPYPLPGTNQQALMLPPQLPSSAQRHAPYGPVGQVPITPPVLALGGDAAGSDDVDLGEPVNPTPIAALVTSGATYPLVHERTSTGGDSASNALHQQSDVTQEEQQTQLLHKTWKTL